jgi:hypothetical protein
VSQEKVIKWLKERDNRAKDQTAKTRSPGQEVVDHAEAEDGSPVRIEQLGVRQEFVERRVQSEPDDVVNASNGS